MGWMGSRNKRVVREDRKKEREGSLGRMVSRSNGLFGRVGSRNRRIVT